MTKSGTIFATLVLMVGMATTPVWAAGGKVRGDNAAGPAGSTGNGAVNTNRGDGTYDTCLSTGILLATEPEE